MTFTVPGNPVSMNNAFPTGRNGRRFTSREYQAWKKAVAAHALAAGIRPIEGPVRVALLIAFSSRRPDLDNAIKPVLDALTGVAYMNDRQVHELHALKGHSPGNPRIVVTVGGCS